jgi:single-strand DNA-binding protein
MARYSVNKVILVGNLGRDPELRYSANGKPIATFSLATSRRRQDPSGTWVDETEWHRIVVWEKVAELASQALHKGSKVYVEGRIQSRKYTDSQGIERTAYDIVAYDLTLIDKREEPDSDWPEPPPAKPQMRPEDLDDVPF